MLREQYLLTRKENAEILTYPTPKFVKHDHLHFVFRVNNIYFFRNHILYDFYFKEPFLNMCCFTFKFFRDDGGLDSYNFTVFECWNYCSRNL